MERGIDSTHSIRNFTLETRLSFCNHLIYQQSLRFWKNRVCPGGNRGKEANQKSKTRVQSTAQERLLQRARAKKKTNL